MVVINKCFTLCFLIVIQTALAETIIQDFTSKKDFDSFWSVSTWGNEEQQYAAANVKLDTANGWVQLKLNASPAGTIPIGGEITSKRENFRYGSYRASIKFDNTPGAVIGWFVYKDAPDLHEIDVEYLTNDIKHIHFTLHHIQTSVDYRKDAITFDPTTSFHEYRFDWYKNKVVYYIDGVTFDSLGVQVPDTACTIMLNIWSANIDDWGGAAPIKDMYMYIDYMHYYSDYTTRSRVPPAARWNNRSDFRIVPKDLRVFKCNGQRVNVFGYEEGKKRSASGLYVRETRRREAFAEMPIGVSRVIDVR